MQPHGSKTSPIYFLLGRCQHECCSCSTDLQLVGVRPSSCLDGCHVRYLWLHKATSPDFLKNLTMAVLFFFLRVSPDWQNCILACIFILCSDFVDLRVMTLAPLREPTISSMDGVYSFSHQTNPKFPSNMILAFAKRWFWCAEGVPCWTLGPSTT